MGVFESLGSLGRHVVLVVLGEHFGGAKDALLVELALGHDALAFGKEVGEDALVLDEMCIRDRSASEVSSMKWLPAPRLPSWLCQVMDTMRSRSSG